jgi:3D (Asp-Asp-Asp) domain-containing protein
MRYEVFAFAVLTALAACQPTKPAPPQPLEITSPAVEKTTPASTNLAVPDATLRFSATAYALEGITKLGTRARRGIVAADPRVIPLGSKIRVADAGSYSGVYTVEDTGAAVKGHIIDIKVASAAEAIAFGRRHVRVELLRRGGEDAVACAK